MAISPPDLLLRMDYEVVLGIPTSISEIAEEFHKFNFRKVEGMAQPEYDQVSRGWFALFKGSRERLFVGAQKPELEKGEEVLIVIMKRKKKETANAGPDEEPNSD